MLSLLSLLVIVALVNGDDDIRGRADIAPNCKQAFSYQVYGKVTMTQKATGGPTAYTIKLEGFQPNTVHGFHVHATGDIYTRGCSSTGGHYNPFGVVHGAREDKTRHVGDLGNLMSDSAGKVDVTFQDKRAGLVGPYSIAGRAFVVHAMKDDLGRGIGEKRAGSQKTGNAGARVACGIIYYA